LIHYYRCLWSPWCRRSSQVSCIWESYNFVREMLIWCKRTYYHPYFKWWLGSTTFFILSLSWCIICNLFLFVYPFDDFSPSIFFFLQWAEVPSKSKICCWKRVTDSEKCFTAKNQGLLYLFARVARFSKCRLVLSFFIFHVDVIIG